MAHDLVGFPNPRKRCRSNTFYFSDSFYHHRSLLEREIDELIAGCNHKTATFLQLLKETGPRPGEAWQLEWIDFDFENKTVNITPEKNNNPRKLKVSDKLILMLKSLPNNQNKVFSGV
jgi:integrase